MDGAEIRYRSAGVELFARAWGHGPPLVLLHGSGLATHVMFEQLAGELWDSCQVIACDVRGFGRSVSRDPTAHTWGQYADDVMALLDHLAMPEAVVGGYSFGAGVAVAAALRHPDRVAGLALAGPGYAGTEMGRTEPQQVVWARGRAVFERARRSGLAESLLATASSDAEHERLRLELAQHDEASFIAAHEGELATAQPFADMRALETLTVPTLLMPASDAAHDPEIALLYAAHLPDVTVASVDMTKPISWTRSLRAFLQP